MISHIIGYNAPTAYEESLWLMRTRGVQENSRNGPVLTVPSPVMLEVMKPAQRLITDATRDANPFFHCMEFIWMMAGSDDAKWLSNFNKRYMEYAEPDGKVWGAYGHRWRWRMGDDQITTVVDMLKRNRQDRRIVMNMWHAHFDLYEDKKDLPCNTQIMFRVVDGALDMLVTNRSNDLIWGMLGANIVHMTMLQELIALASGLKIGMYRVISNNLHIYQSMPKYEEILKSAPTDDIYKRDMYFPLLFGNERIQDFLEDCETLVANRTPYFKTRWMIQVGFPMYLTYLDRKAGMAYSTESIAAEDWRIACETWLSHPSRGLSQESESSKSGSPETSTQKHGW